jgi:hypothetical protein
MSLLEKAIRGSGTSGGRAGTSLFARAMAVHAPEGGEGPAVVEELPIEELPIEEPPVEDEPSIEEEPPIEAESVAEREALPETPPSAEFRFGGADELERSLAALPHYSDSILAAWSLVSESIPLSALSLFLPSGDFLVPAALNGFPSGTMDGIPMSFAGASHKGLEPLGTEAKAQLAPILGVPLALSLRAAAMRPESDFVGLWIYHDPSLDASSAETRTMVGSLLARAGDALPSSAIAAPVPNSARSIIEASRKYPYASAFSFDLAALCPPEEPRFRGLKPAAIRSAFLSSCVKILSKGGAAFASGESSVAGVLGSASPVDPDLVLFQLEKTLRRILPFLASAGLPEGRALGFEPSSELALGELSAFLSR